MWPVGGRQSASRRATNMLRLSLLLILLTHRTRTAYVTDSPSFADRLDKLTDKLDRFTLAPTIKKASEKLYEKLDKLNSLMPGKELTDDDEEVLTAIQLWGSMSEDQLQELAQDMQSIKEEKSDRLTDEYGDGDYTDDDLDQDAEVSEGDYANDVGEEWDPFNEEPSVINKPILGVTPSAITRLEKYRPTIISAVDPIAATNERPRIIDDSHATPEERQAISKAAIANIRAVVKASKCLTPQPRWLSVRKLAPAADTVYTPPCVQLHRCAPDAGCCSDQEEVCAPIDGKHVAIPFFLNKADGKHSVARMLFFNHTRCACVSRETLETTARTKIDRQVSDERADSIRDKQNDWRAPTEEPVLESDEEQSPTQLRRCTCPMVFKSRVTEGVCSCTCEWAEARRRRDCQSLSRGREHFGLRDRVCVHRGDCHPPTCDHGTYDVNAGKCPLRLRFKRRYTIRNRIPSKFV